MKRRLAIALRGVFVLAGIAFVAFGIHGVFLHHRDTNPPEFLRWSVGAAVLHDGLVAPAAVVLGWLVVRALPRGARGPVASAGFVSAVLALFSFAEVRRYASVLHNPSSLPHDYGRNLVLVLVPVWVAAIGVAVWRVVRLRNEELRNA